MPEQKNEEFKEMGFLDHLDEFRSTLIFSIVAWVVLSIVIWFFSGRILDFLLAGIPVDNLYFNAPTEAFITRIKLSFVLGFLVAFPYILFRFWSFVAPGLFFREKRAVFPLVFFSTILFYIGVIFAYWVLIPIVLDFLVRFGTEMLKPLLAVGKYFAFVARLCFAFGLVFQLPLVIIFLTGIGAISPRALIRQWRWAILVIFVTAAILTPPDPASQLLMAVPLVGLFLISVLLSMIIEKRKEKEDENEENDD